jgi:hypothetical protein
LLGEAPGERPARFRPTFAPLYAGRFGAKKTPGFDRGKTAVLRFGRLRKLALLQLRMTQTPGRPSSRPGAKGAKPLLFRHRENSRERAFQICELAGNVTVLHSLLVEMKLSPPHPLARSFHRALSLDAVQAFV